MAESLKFWYRISGIIYYEEARVLLRVGQTIRLRHVMYSVCSLFLAGQVLILPHLVYARPDCVRLANQKTLC